MVPVMLDYINAEIETRKAERAQIESEQESLRHRQESLNQRWHDLGVELRVLEDVRSRSSRDEKAAQDHGDASAGQVNTVEPTPTVTRSKLAPHWRVVLHRAAERFPNSIRTHEVPEIQRAAGYDASPAPNVRSHFHKLRHEGLYEDAGWGAVRATQAAFALLGIPLPTARQNMGTPNGQPLSGGPDRETARRAHEASPAASVHH
jgi:hypothetical protein